MLFPRLVARRLPIVAKQPCEEHYPQEDQDHTPDGREQSGRATDAAQKRTGTIHQKPDQQERHPRPRAKVSIKIAPCQTPLELPAVSTRIAPRIGPVQADQLAPKAMPMRPERHQTERPGFT